MITCISSGFFSDFSLLTALAFLPAHTTLHHPALNWPPKLIRQGTITSRGVSIASPIAYHDH